MASTTLQNVSLGIRAIGSRTDFAGGAVTDLSAEDDRLINMVLDEGFFGGADSFEVVAGSAATMNVVVGSGSAKTDLYCVAGEDAGQGNYVVRLESATETFALTAADGSLARKDEIYVVVLDDAYDSSGKALAVLALRTGDPDASPSAPGPDAAWDAYVLLATIDVPAAAADILACTITDERIEAQVNVQAADADTLDGVEGSGYSLSAHVHTAGEVGASEDDHVHALDEGGATSSLSGTLSGSVGFDDVKHTTAATTDEAGTFLVWGWAQVDWASGSGSQVVELYVNEEAHGGGAFERGTIDFAGGSGRAFLFCQAVVSSVPQGASFDFIMRRSSSSGTVTYSDGGIHFVSLTPQAAV